MNLEAPSIDLPVESKEEGPLANGGPTNEQLTISNFVLSLSHKSIKPVLGNVQGRSFESHFKFPIQLISVKHLSQICLFSETKSFLGGRSLRFSWWGLVFAGFPFPPLHTHASVSLNLFVRPIIAIGKCQGANVWQVSYQIIHTIVICLVG